MRSRISDGCVRKPDIGFIACDDSTNNHRLVAGADSDADHNHNGCCEFVYDRRGDSLGIR